jgi:chemotaxis signal transduction protein
MPLTSVFDPAPAEPTDEPQGLTVMAGPQRVCLALADVRGVARQVPLVPIPDVDDAVLGLANVRGTLVTVLDLERILAGSVTPRPVTTVAESIVLLSGWGGRVAFAVDRCGAVEPLRASTETATVADLVTPWLATANEEYEVDR